VNVAALSATISTAVSQAVQAAMSKQPAGLGNGQNPSPSQMVGEAVDDEVIQSVRLFNSELITLVKV